MSEIVKHGQERHRRIESSFTQTGELAGHGSTRSVVEKWCAHCCSWVTVAGVLGALKFMSEHDGEAS